MNKTTGDVTVNSPTTKFYFNKPQVIKFKSDLNRLLSKITDHSIKHKIDQLLPNTQSELMAVYSLSVKIYELGYKVGTCINLPDHIIKSRRIISLDKVENNLCFWACCALMLGGKKYSLIRKMKQLFIKYYGHTIVIIKDSITLTNYPNLKIHLNMASTLLSINLTSQ